MELRQLKYFAKVAEVGSFTRAAAALDLAQPALSRQIAELEAEVGVPLLARTGRGAVPTEAGLKFLTRAKAILHDVERAAQELQSLQGRPMGLVSLGMPPSISSILAVPLVERIRAVHPQIQLQLTEGYSGHLHEWLLAGQLDLGVLYSTERSVGISCDGLVREQLCLIGSADMLERRLGRAASVRFADLARMPLILPARPHAVRKLVDETAAARQVGITVTLEVSGFFGICDLVSGGHGVTILPVSAVWSQLRGGAFVAARITAPQLTQFVGLVTSSHHPTSLATKAVATVVKKLARELVACGRWPERPGASRTR